jgi:FkbM family methyltransferase
MPSPLHSVGRLLRHAGTELMKANGTTGVWIDVGAHQGETSLFHARDNPGLKVFAIEPNLQVAARLVGLASNYFVIPMAIAEKDGFANFYINEFEASSSLLRLNAEGVKDWIGGEAIKVRDTLTVPTIRLDTLMNLVGIRTVDFLKIDAQGMDLAVVRSAGERLNDISRITLEVAVTRVPLYEGESSKAEVLAFFDNAGFSLVKVEEQTHGQEENVTFERNR